MPIIINNPDGSRTFVNDDGTSQIAYSIVNDGFVPTSEVPTIPAEPKKGTLAHKFWELKYFQYKDSLASNDQGRRDWASSRIKVELKSFSRLLQNGGISAFNRDYRYRYIAQNGLDRLNLMKHKAHQLGQIFKNSINDSDPEDILNWLNNPSYHWFRDHNNWTEYLEDKIGGSYAYCEDCGVIEDCDTMHWAYNGDKIVCESCCNNNYHWSDSRDTYVHDDDEDEEDDSIIGEYHSSSDKLGLIPSDHDKTKNPIYLGIELEMECNGSRDRYERAETLINAIGNREGYNYCFLENDGSLNDGFEMVTGHTSLQVHREQLEFFKTPFAGMKSHDTRTCGLHVHICKTGMTMNHAAKLILFINDSSNQRLIKAIARRDGSSYAQVKNKKASYEWLKNSKQHTGLRNQLMYLNQDRYEALNFKNPNTVEFRLFKGTLRYETIIACLEFTYASWYFAKDSGINDLTTDNFLKYICKPENRGNTKFLREYLKEKNFSIPALGAVKKNPRVETNSQLAVEI